MRIVLSLIVACLFASPSARAADLLVEAESFKAYGGWKLDTQFIHNMGSPYLLAHGLGQRVKYATTTIEMPATGKYRVYVRTKDWVARWGAKGQPGKFELHIDGTPLDTTFGTEGKDWFWHDGGEVNITNKKVTLTLRDLTGFDGRCDAIYFTQGGNPPPNDSKILPKWRRDLLGLKEEITEKKGYDLVVIGGGYSGMGAALSASRMGCKVALIQNRPVLGGNGSSEVRVWAMGLIRRGKFPRIGEIIEEFADRAKKSPGTYEEFGDDLKERIIRAEKNIDLFLNHHAYKVDSEKIAKDAPGTSNEGYDRSITAVYAFDTRTSEYKKFTGKFYVDATGHGTIGYEAGAGWDMTPTGRMGMSNMWRWDEAKAATSFPDTSSWALDLDMKDFPYPRDHHGQWFWESGFDKDAIGDAEGIRDWNLRAVYGAFNAMKNRDGAAKHTNAILTWVAYIGGPRESRRLLGDVILTQDDIVNKKEFKDGCVPSTWSIDLHYPKKQYAAKFPDNPFISIAVHDRRVDRSFGYPVPYRCFYSRNVSNLFMAGRCISVTHEALGTVRVMKTCGMMGEVVGKAASVAVLEKCSPRQVYEHHWDTMDKLLQLPGKARRDTVHDKIVMPANIPSANPLGPPSGLDPKKMDGLVIDDRNAKRSGKWTEGTGLKGYVGHGYLYGNAAGNGSIRFAFAMEKAGTYDVRLGYLPHENRATNVSVNVLIGGKTHSHTINMRKAPPLKDSFYSLGKFKIAAGEKCEVVVVTKGANGNVHADAVQVVAE